MNSRAREVGKLLGYVVLVGVTTRSVTRMLSEAYRDREVIFHVTRMVVEFIGVNIDLAVVVPAGILAGWVVMFTLDEYKKLQAVLLVVAVGIFGWQLSILGRWGETIAWGRFAAWAVASVMLGVVTSFKGATVPQGAGKRTFPAAARYLYAAVYLAIVIGLVEYFINFDPFGLHPGRSVIVVPASLLFLGAAGALVRYSDKREVVLIGSDDAALASFVGGLYTAAQSRYDDVSTTGETGEEFLNKTTTRTSMDELRDLSIPSAVGFQFASDSWFTKRTIVDASQYTPPSRRALASIRRQTATNPTSRALTLAQQAVGTLLPRAVHGVVGSSSRRIVTRVATADVVLLLAPMSDFVDEKALDGAGADTEWESLLRTPPSYLDTYRELCALCENKEMYVIASEADLAMGVYEHREGRRQLIQNRDFKMFILKHILEQGEAWPDSCDVWPVVRSFDNGDSDAATPSSRQEESLKGFDRLVDQL